MTSESHTSGSSQERGWDRKLVGRELCSCVIRSESLTEFCVAVVRFTLDALFEVN